MLPEARMLTLVKQDFLQVLDILLDNATKYGEKKISVKVDMVYVSCACICPRLLYSRNNTRGH